MAHGGAILKRLVKRHGFEWECDDFAVAKRSWQGGRFLVLSHEPWGGFLRIEVRGIKDNRCVWWRLIRVRQVLPSSKPWARLLAQLVNATANKQLRWQELTVDDFHGFGFGEE